MLGPAIVGAVQFRLSNLCLGMICVIPSTIAIVSSCLKREQKKGGDGKVDGSGYEMTPSDVAVDGLDDKDGEGIGDGDINTIDITEAKEKTAIAKVLIPNMLRAVFVLFYFVYIGLETGFGGTMSIDLLG